MERVICRTETMENEQTNWRCVECATRDRHKVVQRKQGHGCHMMVAGQQEVREDSCESDVAMMQQIMVFCRRQFACITQRPIAYTCPNASSTDFPCVTIHPSPSLLLWCMPPERVDSPCAEHQKGSCFTLFFQALRIAVISDHPHILFFAVLLVVPYTISRINISISPKNLTPQPLLSPPRHTFWIFPAREDRPWCRIFDTSEMLRYNKYTGKSSALLPLTSNKTLSRVKRTPTCCSDKQWVVAHIAPQPNQSSTCGSPQ